MKENSIAKKLIFFMYCPDDLSLEVKQIYTIHLKCLKYYWNIFNIHQFILAGNEYDKYIDFIKSILGNVTIDFIKVLNNEQYREGKYYHDIVLPSLENDNCLTFFCHSKGMADLFNKSRIKNNTYNNILDWILIMYFMNLNYIKDVENKLNNGYLCYGTLFLQSPKLRRRVKNNWIYSGSFQWINNMDFINHLFSSNQYNKFKQQDINYYIAEDFLGNYIPIELAATHSMFKPNINIVDDYKYSYNHINLLENNNTITEYNNFKEKINEQCKCKSNTL